jgi:hypothetical protein
VKLEGYTCDAGCGASVAIAPSDHLFRVGWLTTYTPSGFPTLYACSFSCMVRALSRYDDKHALTSGEAS